MQYITTPSHAYLKVSKDKFYPVYEQLTTEQKEFFGYGYADIDNVYLEEDCEAPTYIEVSGDNDAITEVYDEDFDTARIGNMIYKGIQLYSLADFISNI